MKISYNGDNNNSKKSLKQFEEWYYLHTKVNTIKRKKHFGNINTIGKKIFSMIVYILNYIIWVNVYRICDKKIIKALSKTICNVSIVCTIILFLAIILYFKNYHKFKKIKLNLKKEKNSLIISEEGITDITDEITISNKWKQITHVLIGEYYIIITNKTNIMYIFPVEIKEKLLSGLKKYNVNNQIYIIEKNN